MTDDRRLRLAMRSVAIAIAVAAIVDPAITTQRATKPDVVVLASDSARDGALADDVARTLSKQFAVARGPFAGAAATIVAGDALPSANDLSGPLFVVRPSRDAQDVRITSVDAPRNVLTNSRVPVTATTRVANAKGKRLALTLRSGSLALDRATAAIESDDASFATTLTYVPTTAAVVPLRVTASIDDDESPARFSAADIAIDVRDRRWSVLFYDPRPSWMSTFVRRAVERDPRFVVTSRVVTSRGITTDAGQPPRGLSDLADLAGFDAVVVGAAQTLSANDVAGLDAFLRRRGASVVLLLDEATTGALDRLAGVARWVASTDARATTLAVAGHDSLALIASSFAQPASLPMTAQIVVGGARPVVWRESVGAGTLVVSGALDAWRYRDQASASFDRAWQTLIADAASATPAAIALASTPSIARPGEPIEIAATLRDLALASRSPATPSIQVRATIVSADSSSHGQDIRVWPRGQGELVARFRAPRTPGVHRLSFADSKQASEIALVVLPEVARPSSLGDAGLARHAQATGGDTLSAGRIGDLPKQLAAAIRQVPRPVTWRPMRSPWWLLPFTFALAAEWWLRRRRGLA